MTMDRISWLKAWSAEPAYKGHLFYMPFDGEHLFGEPFEKYIQELRVGESTSTPQKQLKPTTSMATTSFH